MQYKVDIRATVQCTHGGLCLIVPTLRVADYGKANLALTTRRLFDAFAITRIHVALTFDARIIRMILHLTR